MNIGIYGPSIALWRPSEKFSWISLIKDHYGANIVHTGTPLCSEERILFDIKKTKKLDLAIIVHTKPRFIFIPSWNRDLRSINKEDVLKKFQHNVLNVEGILEDPKFYQDNVAEHYDDHEEFLESLYLYYKYFVHPDLMRDRFNGALIQIDQYLTARNIPAIHFTGVNTELPSWFNFTSGEVFTSLVELAQGHEVKRSESANGMDAYFNSLLFEKIKPLIDPISKMPSRNT